MSPAAIWPGVPGACHGRTWRGLARHLPVESPSAPLRVASTPFAIRRWGQIRSGEGAIRGLGGLGGRLGEEMQQWLRYEILEGQLPPSLRKWPARHRPWTAGGRLERGRRRGAACDKLEHQPRCVGRRRKRAVPEVVVHDDDRARRSHDGVDCGSPPGLLLAKVWDVPTRVVCAIGIATIVLRAGQQLGRAHLMRRILRVVHYHEPVWLMVPATAPGQAFVGVHVPHRCLGRPLAEVATAVGMQAIARSEEARQSSD